MPYPDWSEYTVERSSKSVRNADSFLVSDIPVLYTDNKLVRIQEAETLIGPGFSPRDPGPPRPLNADNQLFSRFLPAYAV